MTLHNMKFRVSSPAQSEALQSVLFSLGYKWPSGAAVSNTGAEYLYTYNNAILNYGEFLSTFEDKINQEHDTEAFIERHAHNEDNMKAALAKPLSERSLEDAYDQPYSERIFAGIPPALATGDEVSVCPWLDNMGECPVEGSVMVDVEYRCGEVYGGYRADSWTWYARNVDYDIVKWRYHNSADYFKAPKTPSKEKRYIGVDGLPTDDIMKMRLTPQHVLDAIADLEAHPYDEPAAIDSHYNFTYELTEKDIESGTIKIDPYFVSQQWQLGAKDNTGVIFHCLKTLARYTDKNSKEREINALHRSILRLAQLEGVTLK